MDRYNYDEKIIRDILTNVNSIAMIGASPDPSRPSFAVMAFLMAERIKVLPVNPFAFMENIHGESTHGSLHEVPGPIDMVSVFRRREVASKVVDEIIPIAKDKGIKTIWMQLDVYDDDAAKRAEEAGLTVIMDRCPIIEWRRLSIQRD